MNQIEEDSEDDEYLPTVDFPQNFITKFTPDSDCALDVEEIGNCTDFTVNWTCSKNNRTVSHNLTMAMKIQANG